jgi:hypothetical protein
VLRSSSQHRQDAQIALALAKAGHASPPGPGSEQVAAIPFTYATASPLLLLAFLPGAFVNRAVIVITTPFDDPAAALELGTAAAPSLLLEPADSDPLRADQYESAAVVRLTGGGPLQLAIAPGASTQGAGIALVKVKE